MPQPVIKFNGNDGNEHPKEQALSIGILLSENVRNRNRLIIAGDKVINRRVDADITHEGDDAREVTLDVIAFPHLNPDQEHGINSEETQRSIVDGGSDRLECDQPVQGFDLRQPVDVIENHAGKQSRKGPGDNDRDQRVE